MSLLQLPHQVRTAHLLGAAALAGVLGLALWIKGRARAGPSSAADTPNAGNGSDEIILFGFPRVPDAVTCASPFVAKVEAWLRFVHLPYTFREGSPTLSPKGQLPIILHGPNVVADSTFIIKYLQRTYPDAGPSLSDEQEALSIAVHHFVEKHLFPGMFWFRWVQPKSWEWPETGLLNSVPAMLRRPMLQLLIRPSMQALLCYQGIWRHSRADILELMDEGIAALAALLADKHFFTGAQPCVADAAAFAFLDNVLYDQVWADPALKETIQQYSNLVSYTDRIRNTYFAAELAWEETS